MGEQRMKPRSKTSEVHDDGALILRLRRGDLEALGLLYDRHARTVYRTALAMTRDETAAQDVLQDAFLRLLKSVATVDPERPIMPWLYRVTINLCHSYYRKRSWSFVPIDQFRNHLESSKPTPERQAEWQESHDALLSALENLPWQQQVVIVLYYLDELSIPEIAELLLCPVGTVKSRLFYGRHRLRKLLKAEEREHLGLAYGLK